MKVKARTKIGAEYKVDLRNLVKDVGSEIIISDEQIDENGKVVREPVLIFATGGERVGYIPIMELQSWIMHHIYTFIAGKFFESDTYKFLNRVCDFYNQAGINKAIFSIFTGLHPSHFDEPEPLNIFATADINNINSADFSAKLTFGSFTLVTPRSTILTNLFCLFEVSTSWIKESRP